MKTQIITLESHDDLISVRDRMSWAKTPRILLVWPKYEKVTLRQVDLKILQRHAASLGAQLGLVSRIRRVRLDAEALHIPVFKSTGDAQRLAWPKPRRRRKLAQRPPRKDLRQQREQVLVQEEPWRAHPATRILAFLLGVLAVLTLVALFIPQAKITLQPASKMQSLELPVTASPSIASVFITGNIPLLEKRVIVDGTQTITVTGEGVIPQSKAQGVVEFRNLTEQAVAIPSGTVVKNGEGIRFITTVTSEIDGGVGKILQLPVEAVDAGIAGNLDVGAIDAIEGRLGLSLSVTNPKPTKGGRELPSVQASDADRERIKNQLLKTLEEQAREKLVAELSPNDLPFEQTLTMSQILSEEYDPPAGAAGSKLTLKMQAEYVLQYANASDLDQLASLALNASLPFDFQPAANGRMTVKPASEPTLEEDGTAKFRILAERRIVQQIDPAQVTRMIQGFGAWNVETKLKENLPLNADPLVQLYPAWWPWMPIVPFRIAVVTE
jgi:hypothetical protein